ncbi:MAG: ethanolamine ammonia-lyase subunit EutC [Candidatus Sericytochromatia bacterium]
MSKNNIIKDNPWNFLKSFTNARIAIGRSGNSITTNEMLKFQVAHAQARNAVHTEIDIDLFIKDLKELKKEIITLNSAVQNKREYLQRPDLGRKLSLESENILNNYPNKSFDLAIVVTDGLSSSAITRNVKPFLEEFLPKLDGWNLAPLVFVKYGRVAVGDPVASLLKADAVALLVGERPGLSSPDSLGIYMTYNPKVGMTDEGRNCISNIRPEGLNYKRASEKLFYLLNQAKLKKISGVNLKDEMIEDSDWKLIN